MRRSLRMVVVICVEESSITSISVPLFTLSQVMSGLGTPSAVQKNMAGSGDTTLTLMGGAVREGATKESIVIIENSIIWCCVCLVTNQPK